IGSLDSDTIEIVVTVSGGSYKTAYDDATITIAKPTSGDSFVGSGSLPNSAAPVSNGYLAGAPGYPTTLSASLKYNKNKTNAQGKLTVVVKSWNRPDGSPDTILHTYFIQSSAISELTLRPGAASFGAKASIQDVTDPNAPYTVDGGATLQMTVTDGS